MNVNREHWINVVLSDREADALAEMEATTAVGDSDWREAVYLYDVPRSTREIVAGWYVRTVRGGTVTAVRVWSDALPAIREAMEAVEAEYEEYVSGEDEYDQEHVGDLYDHTGEGMTAALWADMR